MPPTAPPTTESEEDLPTATPREELPTLKPDHGLPTAAPEENLPTVTPKDELPTPAPTPEEEKEDEIPEDPKPYLVEYVHKYVIIWMIKANALHDQLNHLRNTFYIFISVWIDLLA